MSMTRNPIEDVSSMGAQPTRSTTYEGGFRQGSERPVRSEAFIARNLQARRSPSTVGDGRGRKSEALRSARSIPTISTAVR